MRLPSGNCLKVRVTRLGLQWMGLDGGFAGKCTEQLREGGFLCKLMIKRPSVKSAMLLIGWRGRRVGAVVLGSVSYSNS